MTRSVVVVDAYSSGSLLAPHFRERGLRLTHVQSRRSVPAIFRGSYRPRDFDEHVVHRRLEQTLSELRRSDVACVLAGGESGVELADELGEALGTLSNGTALSAARRDKLRMVEALERARVRAIPTTRVDDLPSAEEWAKGRYPVVAKPVRSCGTDNVWFCDRPRDLREAFGRVAGRRTVLDEVNEGVLLQEYVSGTEYIVDTVRYEDVVAVAEICQYRKKLLNGSIVYDFVELLPADGEIQDVLRGYTLSVLDALGIRYGPAHLEIIVDGNGPVLVEAGARLDGARAPELCRAATGQDQAETTVCCYTDRAEFEERAGTAYEIRKHLMRVKLMSERSGTIVGMPFLESLETLPSYYSTTSMRRVGDELKKTTGLFDLPGIVELLHPSRDVVLADYARIREWESVGFFQLA